MKSKSLLIFLIAFFLTAAAARGAELSDYGRIPLSFEANLGQADKQVKFLSRGAGYGLLLTEREAVLHLTHASSAEVRIKFDGQNAHPRIEGIDLLPGKTHYLKSAGCCGDIPNYARVRYSGVYPGVDFIYYGNQQQLEYDIVIAPGARPGIVQLHFDGIQEMAIENDGQLLLKTTAGEIRQGKPSIYQESGGKRIAVEGGYVLRGKRDVGFQIASYDSTKPLIIDPVLVYSSFYGGTGTGDQGNAIAIDAAGNAYITGQTTSSDLFVWGGIKGGLGAPVDGFVLKLDPSGTTVLYSTYFGGSANDEGHSIAVDAGGNALVTGYTSSTDFPVINGFQRTRGGLQDAYLLKLNSTGSGIVYSTYLGGSADDRGFAVAVDAGGNACITGTTASSNFPTANPFQRANGGGQTDVFVAKVSPAGSLVYSTYAGGAGVDQSYGIALDGTGSAYVVGYTTSTSFPLVNAVHGTYSGGSDDAFAFKLNATGSALEYSTFIGGSGSDNAVRVAVDNTGSAYITGYTQSVDFPTLNAYSEFPGGDFDVFVTRLAPDGKSMVFSTFIGGVGTDSGTGIGLDRDGNIYIGGYTTSLDFPVVNSLQANLLGDRDAYVVKLTPDAKSIVYSTFVGGAGVDAAVGLAVDAVGNVYLAGLTNSTDFPIAYPFQPVIAGAADAFVTKINGSDVVSSALFQIVNQGGASFQTGGNRGDLVFGYATAESSTPGAPLTGLAILDFKQTGRGGTEVALLAPPFMELGRMYVEVTAVARSVISIANPNAEEASVVLYFTNQSGEQTHFVTVTIPPHAHFSRFVSDEPLLLEDGSVGTLDFRSSIPVAASGFRTFSSAASEFLISATPIVSLTRTTDQPIVVPEFADGAGWQSQVVLVNNTETAMNGEVRFVSQGSATQAGAPVEVGIIEPGVEGATAASAVAYSIPPRAAQRIFTAGASVKSDFPFSGRTGFSFETPGANFNQLSGYATAGSGSVNAPLNGLEILEFRRSGTSVDGAPQTRITTTETAIIAPPLRLAGRFFAEVATSVQTRLSIANPSDQDATVDLYPTDSAGNSSASIAIVVPAHGQVSGFLGEAPFSIVFASSSTVSFISSVPVGVSALRFLTNEITELVVTAIPIGDLNKVSNQPVVIPHFADGAGWKTQVILLNTTDQPMNGEVRFFSQSGGPLEVAMSDGTSPAVVGYTVPPRSYQLVESAGSREDAQLGSIRIVAFGGNTPSAYAMLTLRNATTALTQATIEAKAPARTFRLYAEMFGNLDASAPGATSTAIALANPSSTAATVRLSLTGLNGVSFASPVFLQVPANGQTAVFLNHVPGFESLKAPFQGVLQVDVTAGPDIAAAGLRGMFNERGHFLAATTGPLNEEATSIRLVFPYTTDGAGYTSQFIILNSGAGPNFSGLLQFFAADAAALGLDNMLVGSVHVVPFGGTTTPQAHIILSYVELASTKFQTDVEGQSPARNFRLFAEGTEGFETALPGAVRTNIAFANPYNTAATVRLNLTSFDGRVLGSSSIQVPAQGEVATSLNQVPGFESIPLPFQGILQASVTSGQGVTALGLRATFNSNGSLSMTTTGPLYEDAGIPGLLVFPHIAEGGGYTSRFIIVSGASGQGNAGVLRFFDQNGAPVNLTLTNQ